MKASPRAGGALILSVIAVMVVSILAAGFLQLALSVTRRMSMSSDTLQALNLAEAGLAEAYTGLAVAHTGNVGTSAAPAVFGGGLFWVKAKHDDSGLVELECNAMYGTGRASLGLVCEPQEQPVSGLGFFTLDDLRLNPDTRLDSFDSSQGTYLEQLNTPLNSQALVGSNGDVALASGDTVAGDVSFGPNGKLGLAKGAVVTGSSGARPELEELPPIDVPTIVMSKQPKLAAGASLIVPPGEAGYETLDIGKNGKLVLEGPLTMVVGKLTLRLGAQMTLDTHDGPVQLYVTDTLDLNKGSTVATSSQVTSDAVVMVSAPAGKTVSLGAKSSFYGFIYAPEATVNVAAPYEIFGGLVCHQVQLAAQSGLHCDLALGASLREMLPKMYSWRVVDLPQTAAARRSDPFQVLGLDPDTLRTPARAHEDQVLDVRYVGTDGNTHSYSGQESDFDWSLVLQLLAGVRDGVAFLLPVAPPATVAPNPLLDLVNSGMNSSALRDALIAASPVGDDVLAAACARSPTMTTSHLKKVLDANVGMGDTALTAAIASNALDSSNLKGVLAANSPLSPGVLAAVLARLPPLKASDLLAVLAKQ